MSDDGSATIRKYQRKIDKLNEDDKSATENMKSVIAKAMKEEGTHRNIAKELLDARRGGKQMDSREGYGDDGEIITGEAKDSPWTRD
jgi:hypothetical protein